MCPNDFCRRLTACLVYGFIQIRLFTEQDVVYWSAAKDVRHNADL